MWLCVDVLMSSDSGQSTGVWSDAGEHLVETVVCHGGSGGGHEGHGGGPNFAKADTVNVNTTQAIHLPLHTA